MDENGGTLTTHRNRVMICEDNPELVQLIQQTLGAKYSTIVVNSGINCLSRYIDEKAKGNHIDVLLVDYELKDLPGDIIATTVRELSGNRLITHTILIGSKQVDKELIEELKSKEYIIDSLEKPICTDALIAIVEKVVA